MASNMRLSATLPGAVNNYGSGTSPLPDDDVQQPADDATERCEDNWRSGMICPTPEGLAKVRSKEAAPPPPAPSPAAAGAGKAAESSVNRAIRGIDQALKASALPPWETPGGTQRVPTAEEYLKASRAAKGPDIGCIYPQYPEFSPGTLGLQPRTLSDKDDYLAGYRRALERQTQCSPEEITEMVSAKHQAIDLARLSQLTALIQEAIGSQALKSVFTDDEFQPLRGDYQVMAAAPDEGVALLLKSLAFDLAEPQLKEEVIRSLSSLGMQGSRSGMAPSDLQRQVQVHQQRRLPDDSRPRDARFGSLSPKDHRSDAQMRQGLGYGRDLVIPGSAVKQALRQEWNKRLAAAANEIQSLRAQGRIDEPEQHILDIFVRTAKEWVEENAR